MIGEPLRTLTVEYLPSRWMDVYGQATRGAVLLWHGRGPNERHVMAPVARLTAERGVVVMVPDWDSTRPDGGREELLASLRHAQHLLPNREGRTGLVLAGWSLGGSAAASLMLTTEGEVAEATVCIAGDFTTAEPFSGRRALDLVIQTDRPAEFHLIHGTNDEVVDVAGARQFAQRLAASGHQVRLEEHPTDHAGVVMARYDPEIRACRRSHAPHAANAGTAVSRMLVDAAMVDIDGCRRTAPVRKTDPMSQETWETPEKITAAMQRFAGRLHGWQAPAAFGVVLVPQPRLGTSEVRFPVVNVPIHGLPAMVMGLLTGRRSESATYDLSPSELDGAIALLAPAEAAHMLNHPNLLAWRQIAADWHQDPSAQAFVVFIADFSDGVTSPYDEALRRQIQSGERSAEIHVTEHS